MTQLRLRHDVIWREADGEVLALDGESAKYVSANSTGLLLWKALVDGATREELAGRLVEEFDIDASSAKRDVDAFVADLAANGFLET